MIRAQQGEGYDVQLAERRSRRIAWALVVAWAAVIFFMSAKTASDFHSDTDLIAILNRWVSGVATGILGHEVDVSPVGHFGEYLVFGALLMNVWRHYLPPGRAALASIAVSAAYAVTDEFHQVFVPGRSCDPADWLVDVTATAVSALVGWLILRYARRKEPEGTPE